MAWRLEKAIPEWNDFAAEMKDSWQRRSWTERLVKIPIDLFVEGFRRMPYTLGHVVFWFLVIKYAGIPLVTHFL